VCSVHDRARVVELAGFVPQSAIVPMAVAAYDEGFFDCRTLVACLDADGQHVEAFVSIKPPELTWLYVDPAHHRRGIGRMLVNHVLPALGPDAFLLCTEESPAAPALYRSCGFVLAARFPGEAHGHRCTCLRMCLPTSCHRDRPPKPSALALQLAGYSDSDCGHPIRGECGVWEWTRHH
jgi:ribosomal protein S18 acetylase RimI-like enzyme